METILKGVIINDPNSIHHLKQKDVRISHGMLVAIEDQLETNANDEILEQPGSMLSIGWMDLQTDFADPGREQMEGLENGASAAAAGGFTHVVINTDQSPAPDTKSAIVYLNSRAQGLPARVLPMGTISLNREGNQLSEMDDLKKAGAVGFTDDRPIDNTELLRRALEYAVNLNTPIVTLPLDFGLNSNPMMHEGASSIHMGVVGNPSASETMRIKRDLDVLRYAGGKLHFSCISTAESVELIQAAKDEGLQVTCSTSAHHLFFVDEDLARFDGTLKTMPPFRAETDRKALCKGVIDGTIDAVISDHRPQDLEHHDVEFMLAPFGLSSIESVYPVARAGLSSLKDGEDALIRALTSGPRQVLGLQIPKIEAGERADLTWYHPDLVWLGSAVSIGANRPDYSDRKTPFNGSGKPLRTWI